MKNQGKLTVEPCSLSPGCYNVYDENKKYVDTVYESIPMANKAVKFNQVLIEITPIVYNNTQYYKLWVNSFD